MKYFTAALALAAITQVRAQVCTVDSNELHQPIDGFGASSAFIGFSWTTAQADMFFSTNTGIGLSLLRTQVQPGGFANANEIALMQMAQARGARIWSTPWTPQASFKDNNSTIGGNFLSASNQAYANQLAGYVAKLTNSNVHLYALSIQNEPDANVNYVSCHWSAQQFHDFIPYLRSALVASNVAATKILFAESESWYRTSLESTAMNDPSVAAYVGIFANHNYDGIDFNHGATSVPNAPATYGKALWETEVSTGDAFDGSITNAIYWAGRIHLFMTAAQVNAWHYWWLIPLGTDNEGLTDGSGRPAKRMYALGQFSRFVRPNFRRIGANNSQSTTQVSAYKDSGSPGFAIVAINTSNTNIAQMFVLTNFTAVSVVPWLTSASVSLAKQSSVTLTNSAFTYQLPPMSVVTFVGQASISNAPFQLRGIADQTINAGQSLLITNGPTAALGTNQTLTYSLLAGPTNAFLNGATGIFSWRPTVTQAATTNLIVIKATDNSTFPLSSTNSFVISVRALSLPVLTAMSSGLGTVQLTVNGANGPDYGLEFSTNLTDWFVILQTNSPALPLILQDTNNHGPATFYRIQLGP